MSYHASPSRLRCCGPHHRIGRGRRVAVLFRAASRSRLQAVDRTASPSPATASPSSARGGLLRRPMLSRGRLLRVDGPAPAGWLRVEIQGDEGVLKAG